jgi:hypothetical protein
MNTNLVQIDPATLSAIQSLPPQWQHYAVVAVAILSAITMLGRAATALMNDAPVLKSVFLGSVHAQVPDPTSADLHPTPHPAQVAAENKSFIPPTSAAPPK